MSSLPIRVIKRLSRWSLKANALVSSTFSSRPSARARRQEAAIARFSWCTVPVPSPSSLAVFTMPVPLASSRRALPNFSGSAPCRPSRLRTMPYAEAAYCPTSTRPTQDARHRRCTWCRQGLYRALPRRHRQSCDSAGHQGRRHPGVGCVRGNSTNPPTRWALTRPVHGPRMADQALFSWALGRSLPRSQS
jgi:hypothetical protein